MNGLSPKKSSGVDWIGNLPGHWDVAPLFTVFSEVKIKNVDLQEDTVLSLSYGKIVTRDVDSNEGLLPESFDGYTCVRPGDIVMRLTDLQNDQRSLRTGLVRDKGIVTSAYVSLRPRDSLLASFGHYLLHAYDLLKVYYGLGSGLRQTMRFQDLKRLPVIVPPLSEQHSIAAFLDRKTAQIDALIAAYERLLALLEEKRQAVIAQAVTKGLDPTVPMKDSGVEWLGDVPAHWRISKLGRLAMEFQTGPFGSQLHASDYIEDGTPVINPANLSSGDIKPDPQNTVDDNIVARLSRHKLREGDIVFGRRGEMGRCALVTRQSVGFLCGTGCIVVRVNTHVMTPPFAAIYMRTQGIREFLQLQSVGSTMDNLNTSILSSIPFAVPPYIEQQQITEHVAHQITQYGELAQSVRRATALLAEYRSALITAAVTGQIDVREEVAQDV